MNPFERLRGHYSESKVRELQENTENMMCRSDRIRITRHYVRYVFGENIRRFESSHPVAEVISYTVNKLIKDFPSMRDWETSAESPTYVSTLHYQNNILI